MDQTIVLTDYQWLIAKGQDQKAIKILAKYHANGYLDDALVKYEHQEICRAIKLEEESKNVRYRDFVATPGNRRRLLVLITMATGTVSRNQPTGPMEVNANLLSRTGLAMA